MATGDVQAIRLHDLAGRRLIILRERRKRLDLQTREERTQEQMCDGQAPLYGELYMPWLTLLRVGLSSWKLLMSGARGGSWAQYALRGLDKKKTVLCLVLSMSKGGTIVLAVSESLVFCWAVSESLVGVEGVDLAPLRVD